VSDRARRATAVLEILTAIGLLLFWTAFFTVGLAPATPPPGYFAFEHAFPVPDVLLAVALLVAASFLLDGRAGRQRRGRVLSAACAGALLFLGVLDISFNVHNGMYAISALDTVLSLSINAWCVGFGAFVVLQEARAARKD
jgi:hypothetical protein